MAESSYSPYPLFMSARTRAKSLVLSRWGAIAAGAFLLGLVGLPFFDQLDKSDGFARLLTPVIVLALALPLFALILVMYLGVRWFMLESSAAIRRSAENPANVNSKRAVRCAQFFVAGGRMSRGAVQEGGVWVSAVGQMALGLVALLFSLLVCVFVIGGIIGLLIIGWNAL